MVYIIWEGFKIMRKKEERESLERGEKNILYDYLLLLKINEFMKLIEKGKRER